MIGDRFLTKKEFDIFVKNLNLRLSGLSITGAGADLPTYTLAHNELESIQGGGVGDYYHFTQVEHDALLDGSWILCINNEVLCADNDILVWPPE